MQLGYYEFANHGDLLLLGTIGLFLVAKNWWDIISYGLHRNDAPTAWPSAIRRLRRRGKSLHRPLRHHHA